MRSQMAPLRAEKAASFIINVHHTMHMCSSTVFCLKRGKCLENGGKTKEWWERMITKQILEAKRSTHVQHKCKTFEFEYALETGPQKNFLHLVGCDFLDSSIKFPFIARRGIRS